MELSENISSAYFSQWVQTSAESKFYRDDSRTSKGSRRNSRKTSRQDSRTSFTKLYSPKAKYSEDEFKEALQRWIEYPEQEETMKLKKLVRQGVQPKLRSELWNDSSGGADIVFNSPHYYEEMIDDMGKKISRNPFTVGGGGREEGGGEGRGNPRVKGVGSGKYRPSCPLLSHFTRSQTLGGGEIL